MVNHRGFFFGAKTPLFFQRVLELRLVHAHVPKFPLQFFFEVKKMFMKNRDPYNGL